MLLEERSSCNKCLFRKKGLLLLGLFTILVGITAVVTSKIVWPVIVAAYEGTQAQLANATELADFSFDNLTNTTEIICNFTLDKVIKEKNGYWRYYFWNEEDWRPEGTGLNTTSTLIKWVLKEIEGYLS
eukprot:TRINITY_DN11410_c0_g2_i9.p2 TRINITY_DN11410_c0_g2~~TRINITY_DN11410_c0_g2_i9.p2  ORF type:complete len:129 (+),score=21.61 TRINITY_DN11410_c0_g2_i9:106-492(+)